MANMRSTRRSSSRAITYVVLKDFGGGISAASDKVAMHEGTTPMARNVEWRKTGGFAVRKGVGAATYGQFGLELAAPGQVPVQFFHYLHEASSSVPFTSQYLLSCENGSVRVAVDSGTDLGAGAGNWNVMAIAGTPIVTTGPPIFAAWEDLVYLSLGVGATSALATGMKRWNGTTATLLGRAYADDYAAPTGGNMPPARYLAAFAERMWLACLVPDSGPLLGSTVRFSHPGRPEDWASDDSIVVGQQGDTITAIAAMRDMLVVFKRSSTHAILGSGSTNFRVVEVSGTIGCTGQWTRDDQGSVVFWDASIGLCKFDGKHVTNLFEPLRQFITDRAISRCGGVVTDGDRIYVATDFMDYYGDRVPVPAAMLGDYGRIIPRSVEPEPRVVGSFNPGAVPWSDLTSNNVPWSSTATFPWLRVAVEFYNIIWVYRQDAGWTSFSLMHPDAAQITMLGQVRARVNAEGSVQPSRRIVYGLSNGTIPLYLSDRYDNGRDWWTQNNQSPIDAFYMTPWLHGGLPAQIKRWKAPRVIQEADAAGNLLIDVFYDFNYDFLRRTLKVGVAAPLSFDSYSVGKPGTIGRAKAVMLVVRPEEPRHWGVSSLTIPLHPKVMR